jgi:predicted metalloprotease
MDDLTAATRRERRVAATRRRRLLTLLVAPIALTVLAVGTMGAAPSTDGEPFSGNADETIADLQAYWAATMPEVYGQSYEAIPADRLFPYSEENPPPGCGTRGSIPYAQVAGNAFYCGLNDFVAWDTQQLFPRLSDQFGAFAPALVLAHEWGHAVQARVGFQRAPTVYLEQQADCFAGAWAQHVASGDSALSLSSADLDRALAGMLQLSDPVGVDASQEGAHGNGFDRVGAFQDGVERGAAACARHQTDPPPVTEAGFTSQADYLSGGDMSLDELVPALTDALDAYWSQTMGSDVATPELVAASGAAACDDGDDGGVLVASVSYCPSTGEILYDPATLREAHSQVGDFAAGLLVAAEWSSAVQHDLGNPLGTDAARRTSECLTGAFTASLDGSTRRTTGDGITLSPGDLDEVVTMLVGAPGGDEHGSAFARVAAFRTGYVDGAGTCTTL